jgi:hypothetical protein
MKNSLLDDAPLRRRVLAVQLGLLTALLVSLVGQGAELSTSVWAQLPVVVASVAFALLVERLLRPDLSPQRRGQSSPPSWAGLGRVTGSGSTRSGS